MDDAGPEEGVQRARLHAPRAPDARVRDVTIAADLVAGVDNHNAPRVRLRQQPRHLPDHRRLAHTRAALRVTVQPV